MKKLLLLVILSLALAACSNEAGLEEQKINSLSEDKQENIKDNVTHRGVYLYDFSAKTPLLVARVSEGSTIELEEVDDGVVGVNIEENPDSEDDELKIFRMTLPNEVDEVKLYMDGLETHFDGVQR